MSTDLQNPSEAFVAELSALLHDMGASQAICRLLSVKYTVDDNPAVREGFAIIVDAVPTKQLAADILAELSYVLEKHKLRVQQVH